jgi:hypothetical protein
MAPTPVDIAAEKFSHAAFLVCRVRPDEAACRHARAAFLSPVRRQVFSTGLTTRWVGIDEVADKADRRLMGSRLASTEKVTYLDFSRRSAGRHVSLVQDEDAAIVVAAEKPSVAVLAMVNLALVV